MRIRTSFATITFFCSLTLSLIACDFLPQGAYPPCETSTDCATGSHCSDRFCYPSSQLTLKEEITSGSDKSVLEKPLDDGDAGEQIADQSEPQSPDQKEIEETEKSAEPQTDISDSPDTADVKNNEQPDIDLCAKFTKIGSSCKIPGLKGECSNGKIFCSNGKITCQTTYTPQAENCDGKDNDCDGLVDQGLGTLFCGKGECKITTTICKNGIIQTCTPKKPKPETCNNKDDDCDGQIDEGLTGCCKTGETRSCGSSSVGTCQKGTQKCDSSQRWGSCIGKIEPAKEVCDGLDNDCNGTTDDGLGTINCGQSLCINTVKKCIAGAVQTCKPKPGSPEKCDRIDNDCNGKVDDVAAVKLASDVKNCGGCGNVCGIYAKSTPSCVAGNCVLSCSKRWFNPENNTSSVNMSKGCYCLLGSLGVEACNNQDDDCNGVKDEACQPLEMFLRAVPGPTYVPDESMKARVGYLKNAKLNSTDKILVASIDTTGGYIDVAFVSTMPPLSGGATLAFWIKLKAFNASSILVRRGALSICKIGTGSVDCSCQKQGGRITSKTSIPYTWTHVAFVTKSNQQSLYINGVLNKSSAATCSSDKNSKFVIGENTSALFDAVMYASRSFSAAEILKVYRIQKGK